MKLALDYFRELGRSTVAGWNRFWFNPVDPATLSLIRILAGLMLLYTHLVWSLDLEAFFGKKSWVDAAAAKEEARTKLAAERLETQRMREVDRLAAQQRREAERAAREAAKPSMTDKMLQSAGRSVASSVGRQLGTQLLRGILGGLFKGR